MFARRGLVSGVRQGVRQFSTKPGARKIPALGLGVAAATAVSGLAIWKHREEIARRAIPVLAALDVRSEVQPSVYSQGKNEALYLWIYLKPEADVKACGKALANLQKMVDEVCPPAMRDEDDEVWAGVGFGYDTLQKLGIKPNENFTYPHRKGANGDMPSSGGDIFIHAKSNDHSKLFELAQKVVNALPAGSVQDFEDVYGWVYQNGRDLSGFIDGTENSADDDSRFDVAVQKTNGGSYCITQKWLHDLEYIAKEKERNLESFVGRSRADSIELKRKAESSHVARMVGSTAFHDKKKFEIVRQSMPFGTVREQHGLFFIGYAESPRNFEFMLDRMVGTNDSHHDDIMKFTKNVKGTYWYFPSLGELKRV